MTDIMEIITQFRCGEIAITGDVRKMWQILLDKTDEQYHGLIYKDQTYVFTRVSFGGTSSPNMADACMVSIAASGERTHPAGSSVIKDKRYADDVFDASSGISKIIQRRDETPTLLGVFGFKIKE